MDVRGLGSVGPAVPVNQPRPTAMPKQVETSAPQSPQDQVEISDVGKMLEEASRTPGVREQRLAQIRAAIDAGTYDTPEKLEIALSRMIDQATREMNEKK